MPALIIFIASALTHLFHLGQPFSVVFDEVYFGDFVNHYWQGTYFFDIHPPLAKLLTAGIGYMLGLQNYSIDWSRIGDVLPPAAVALRYMPTLAGIILPLIIYALCRRLRLSVPSSMTAGLLVVLENSLIVQSKFILFDVVLLVCGFASLLFYLEYVRRTGRMRFLFLALSATGAAAALSIKWTGLSYLFLILLAEAYGAYTRNRISVKQRLKNYAAVAGSYLAVAAVIYVGVFAIHFAVLTKAGPGDAFMSPGFRKTLSGSQYADSTGIAPEGFPAKFVELNKEMYTASETLTATHEYSSKWYTWPFMLRPIFYWQGTDSYIYLFGNPFIYWLGTLAMACLIVMVATSSATRRQALKRRIGLPLPVFLITGYMANFLPFILIGRVMFLYHYEAALVFSILAVAYLMDRLGGKAKYVAMSAILLPALAAFIFWSPLTYGLPLTQRQLNERIWFASWR